MVLLVRCLLFAVAVRASFGGEEGEMTVIGDDTGRGGLAKLAHEIKRFEATINKRMDRVEQLVANPGRDSAASPAFTPGKSLVTEEGTKAWNDIVSKFDISSIRDKKKANCGTPAYDCGAEHCSACNGADGKKRYFGMDFCACGSWNDECPVLSDPSAKAEQGAFAICNPTLRSHNPSIKKACSANNNNDNTWSDFVDQILVINLVRRPDRRHYNTEMMKTLGVPDEKLKFFDAIDVKQWATPPFMKRLTDIFHHSPGDLISADVKEEGTDCCSKRLNDPSVQCDVSRCGLAASGLSHLAAIHYWYNSVIDSPGNPSVLIMEDDSCPTAHLFSEETKKTLANLPEGWKLLKLEDCIGRYGNYYDKDCTGSCNPWKLVKDIREIHHGAACVSAYALNKKSAGELLRWGNVYRAVQEQRSKLWAYAMIEDVMNVLTWGPWAETSWQTQNNLFVQVGTYCISCMLLTDGYSLCDYRRKDWTHLKEMAPSQTITQ
jgi:hypothetical protein